MNATDREQLRLSLLRYLDANNTRFGISTSLLFQFCRNEGRPNLTLQQTEEELQYLVDKGFADEALKGISPENRNWRINAEGRDYIAQR